MRINCLMKCLNECWSDLMNSIWKEYETVGRLPERADSVNGWGLAFGGCSDRAIVIDEPRTSGPGFIVMNSISKSAKVHQNPPQSFTTVIELLLESTITFVPPSEDKTVAGESSLVIDMEIDVASSKGKGKAIASGSEEKEDTGQEFFESSTKVVFILKLLKEILLMYGPSIHVLVWKDFEFSSSRGGGIFHHILGSFLPHSRNSKRKKRRMRIGGTKKQSPRNDIQAFVDMLDDILVARLRARSPIGSSISGEASATFIDVGRVRSLTQTLHLLDLDHVDSLKVAPALVKAYGGSEFVTDDMEHDQYIDRGYDPPSEDDVDYTSSLNTTSIPYLIAGSLRSYQTTLDNQYNKSLVSKDDNETQFVASPSRSLSQYLLSRYLDTHLSDQTRHKVFATLRKSRISMTHKSFSLSSWVNMISKIGKWAVIIAWHYRAFTISRNHQRKIYDPNPSTIDRFDACSGYASLPLQRIMEESEGSKPVMMRSDMLQNRYSTKPSDNITKPAGPSQSVSDDLPNSQIESNEVVRPSCTPKGDCVMTSNPDPQQESKLHTTIPQPQCGQQIVVLGNGDKSKYDRESSDGVYNIDLKVKLKMRLKVGWAKPKFKPKFECDLRLPLTTGARVASTSSGFQRTKCDFDWIIVRDCIYDYVLGVH
nr:E3 ubiquitin-protein ligase UPL2-like [Tanacetum cinerariifolium]